MASNLQGNLPEPAELSRLLLAAKPSSYED